MCRDGESETGDVFFFFLFFCTNEYILIYLKKIKNIYIYMLGIQGD